MTHASPLPEPTPPVTLVVAREVKPGSEAAFEAWARGIIAAGSAFPGHQGASILRRGVGQREYVLVVRFATFEDLRRWEESDVCRAHVEACTPLITGPAHLQTSTGLETWFDLPDRPGTAPPPKWKMALATFLGIYPLIVTLSYVLGPRLADLPVPLRTLAMSSLLVPSMTWVVMPRVTQLLRGWLYPRSGSA